jgi:hypothetical protein
VRPIPRIHTFGRRMSNPSQGHGRFQGRKPLITSLKSFRGFPFCFGAISTGVTPFSWVYLHIAHLNSESDILSFRQLKRSFVLTGQHAYTLNRGVTHSLLVSTIFTASCIDLFRGLTRSFVFTGQHTYTLIRGVTPSVVSHLLYET